MCSYVHLQQTDTLINWNWVQNANQSFGSAVKSGAEKVVSGTKEVFGVLSGIDKSMDELLKLKEMKDKELITEEEYDAMRRKLLKIDWLIIFFCVSSGEFLKTLFFCAQIGKIRKSIS